jgi:hypothetical protein
MSQDATESQWNEFIRLYRSSRDGRDPVATVKGLAAVALGVFPGTVEYGESREESDEDAGGDSKVPTKKRKVIGNGDETPDEDSSWKEGDDDEDVDEEEDIEDDVEGDEEENEESVRSDRNEEETEAEGSEDEVSAPRTQTKRKKISQEVVAIAVGSSPKQRKESQVPPHVLRSNGTAATAKNRAVALANVLSTSNTRRSTQAWHNIEPI